MYIFNYRNLADTYQAPVNGLQNSGGRVVEKVDNIIPPRSANSNDTAAASELSTIINSPNTAYKSKSDFLPDSLMPGQFRETELNMSDIGRVVNITA